MAKHAVPQRVEIANVAKVSKLADALGVPKTNVLDAILTYCPMADLVALATGAQDAEYVERIDRRELDFIDRLADRVADKIGERESMGRDIEIADLEKKVVAAICIATTDFMRSAQKHVKAKSSGW